MRKYTTAELLKLMKIRAKGFDTYLDDVHTTERAMFENSIEKFIEWLNKMEYEGKTDYLLTLPD
ncbi:MAG TPA: hypothetical protein VFT06_00365 [Flavisolibacter sp.]|nr:hypothetical protein [Flavisolibacter sp.]